MSVATEQMICQEHLWTVLYVHDDSGWGSTNGRLPFELDDTLIPERKFGFRRGLGCHGHVDAYNHTGLFRAFLAQVRWNGDVQDQVRDGNEQTGHMEDPRFHYAWRVPLSPSL